ncbi:MAG: response regulator [Candidatus Acidiferrales bacterium]
MRVLIADDSKLVRRSVAALLSSQLNWEICGEAADGAEALGEARKLLPDLILLDIRMPGMNGLETARLLRQAVPAAKIIVMSQYDPARLLPYVIEAGAHGCVDKNCLATDLLGVVKAAGAEPGARQARGAP